LKSKNMFKKLLLLAITSTCSMLAASLTFEPELLNMGNLRSGATVTQFVTLHNPSAATVRLLTTKTDCGCTIANPSVRSLGAGDSTQLAVTFDSQKMKGEIFRKVRVTSSIGTFTLPVRAYVNPFGAWQAEAATINFPPSLTEERQELYWSFHHTITKEHPSPRLDSAWSSAKWLKVTVMPTKTPGRYGLKLVRLPGAPAGQSQTVVSLKTNTSDTVFTLPVSALIRGQVVVSPNPITFGTGVINQPRLKRVTVEGWAGLNPPVLKVPQGTATYEGFKDGKLEYLITVTPIKQGLANLSLVVYPPHTELSAPELPTETPALSSVPIIIRGL
jgi:hypothetical protein